MKFMEKCNTSQSVSTLYFFFIYFQYTEFGQLWVTWCASRTDCIVLYVDKLQVHSHMVIMSFNSAFHGLNLVAVHAQGKWHNHF